MILTQVICYYQIDGKVFYGEDSPNDEIIHEVSVEFEAFPRWENDGIGSYEYWGSKEYDYGRNYVSLEFYGEPTYNSEDYTPDENEAIHLYINSPDFDKLCDKFCKIYAKENK
jgi:hypothetical protein